MIKGLLLPREKYTEERQKLGPAPFTFEIDNGEQVLYYFGANHSRNPQDGQYPKLRDYWQQFLSKTEGKERLVLLEGKLRDLEETEEEAIIQHSEGGFITVLAHKENVPMACPDIKDDELEKMVSQYSREDFLLRWFLVWSDNFKTRAEPKPDFMEYLESFAGGNGTTAQKFLELYKKEFGKNFDLNDNLNSLIDPNKTGTRLNEISRTMSNLRDEKIVEEIVKYWKEKKNILVVFGNGHLVIQKPALEVLLTK
jgi:hypothetical protein